ncbi:MAG: type IV pili twitching motility protein PilT, partial [Acidimicrobiia bacterium]
TLRTMGAVGTVQRIVDVLPVELQQQARVQLADTLRGIVVQQLVPGVEGGMVLAAEVLVATPAVRSAIRDGDPAALEKAILGGTGAGMRTMDQALASLVQQRRVRASEALARAVDPTELRYLLGQE